MKELLNKIFHKLTAMCCQKQQIPNLAEYWQARVKLHGKRSVLNLAHSEDEFDAVTATQKQILFPLLKEELLGYETRVLDFGCGPGRFTSDLAELIGGQAVGVDIVPELLKLAPPTARTSYECISSTGTLPFVSASFDIVWSCLVPGGIPDNTLNYTMAEIERVLKPAGLFFYVEGTALRSDTAYWFYRSQEVYINLGSFCAIKVVGKYEDKGEPISVFSGRKYK